MGVLRAVLTHNRVVLRAVLTLNMGPLGVILTLNVVLLIYEFSINLCYNKLSI